MELKFNGKKRLTGEILPARLIVISFAVVICVGTILLSLPIASRDGHFTNLLDSLFTATSATCVTGLVVYDTYLKWSVFGQLVILFLIQIGGLGLLTITTFFNIALGKKLGLRSMVVASESVNTSTLSGITSLIKMVVILTFSAELFGALVLSTVFIPKYGYIQGIFTSIFLSISAFCNAGFDLLGREGPYTSLTQFNGNTVILGTISLLIIVGGLGFIVWQDLMNFRKTKKLALHTKIVLIVTGILIVVGTIVFMALEWNNASTMGNFTFGEKLNACFFQSITTRTAGFNSIDLAAARDSTKLSSLILMFIGAAPGSTGGGIKVTTFTVIVMTVMSVIKGKSDTVIMHRKVNHSIVYRSIAIIFLAVVSIFIATLFISASIDRGMGSALGVDSVFEAVSAFATVGLSTGITGIVGKTGKIALIALMFIGRVGPVSLGLSIAMRQSNTKNAVIPEGRIIVG